MHPYRKMLGRDGGRRQKWCTFVVLYMCFLLGVKFRQLVNRSKYLLYRFTQVTADVEESSVIIGERSRAAIEALRRAIDESHHRIAILMVLATCQTWEGNYGRSSIIFLPGFNR